MADISNLISRLDIVAPKNPKSDWSKRQRQIIDEAISVLKEYDKLMKEQSASTDNIEITERR